MEEKRNHIDEYIKQSLDGFEPEPSDKVWKEIKGKLAWKEFVRFNFTNFASNIYQISATILIGAGILTGLFTQILLVDKMHKEKSILLLKKEDTAATPPLDSSKILQKPFDSMRTVSTEPSQKHLPPSPVSLPPTSTSSQIKTESEEISSPETLRIERLFMPISPMISKDKSYITYQTDIKLYLTNIKTKDSISYGPIDSMKYPYQLSLGAGWWFNWMTLPYAEKDFSYYWNAVGLDLKLEHRNFFAKTGLNFSRMFDRLPYDISYKSYDSIGFAYNVHYYVPDPSHPDQVILITSKETLYDSITHKQNIFTTGTYNYLNIPFEVGYQFLKAKGFTLEVYGGCGLQFLISKKEPSPVIFDYEKSGLQLTPFNIQHYDFNYFFFGGFNIQYLFVPRLKLELEPVYQYYMKSLRDQEGAGNPYSWGIKVGINYNF